MKLIDRLAQWLMTHGFKRDMVEHETAVERPVVTEKTILMEYHQERNRIITKSKDDIATMTHEFERARIDRIVRAEHDCDVLTAETQVKLDAYYHDRR